MEIPKDLREAIDQAVAGIPGRDLAAVVERLIERYRAGGVAVEPILAGATDAAAYAAYRMPATFAAVRAALGQLAGRGLAPQSQLDLGGGTGSALWAAADRFRTLVTATVLDRVPATLDLGRRIAAGADAKVVRGAAWRQDTVDSELPRADLVTLSYVLSELSEEDLTAVVRRAASTAAELVVIVEPGTPAGYRRILLARTELLEAGLTVLAPCPHQHACPLAAGRDWCHFAARVSRSALHRRLKAAELSYEDEKFSFVAAARGGAAGGGVARGGAAGGGVAREGAAAAAGRVIRRPVQRKGLVSLEVCASDPGVATQLVPRSQTDRYRAARDLTWGDAWPPVS
jgi:ribosomal protein RSM22 (predicted rRNA methylase)